MPPPPVFVPEVVQMVPDDDEEIEDDANVLEPEDFLWQKLDVSERRARPDPT